MRFGTASKRLWRPLIGIVAAYAVAAQSLLIALGGFAVLAHADQTAPAFELCLHDNQDAPALPAGTPSDHGCSHCIFCFAGSHQAAIGSPPAVFARAIVAATDLLWAADKSSLPRFSRYSIANARGPPLGA